MFEGFKGGKGNVESSPTHVFVNKYTPMIVNVDKIASVE